MKINQLTIFLILVLTYLSGQTYSQTKHEAGFVTDNDLYVSIYLDEYYTNGLELFYKQAFTSSYANFNKKIKRFSIQQNIYNPQHTNVEIVKYQERPYAGYLYANYLEKFINNKNLLSIGATIGVIGQKTGAEEAQNFIHQFYDIDPSEGWETQVKEKYAFGFLVEYTRNLSYNKNRSIETSWISKATINTVLTNVTSGLAFRLNFLKTELNPISNTSFYDTALQIENEDWIKECYLGVKSYITYQIQDYTVTGELNNNPTQEIFHIKPWVWHNDIGVYWDLEHMNISYHQIFETKSVEEIQENWIRYGSIKLSYKF